MNSNQNLLLLYFFISILILSSCKSTDPTPIEDNIISSGPITFVKHIQPLIRDKCAPCHVSGGDRSNKYDDYNTLNTLITGVIGRVIKDKNEPLFMPKNGEKLNTKEMALLRKWIADGQLEK